MCLDYLYNIYELLKCTYSRWKGFSGLLGLNIPEQNVFSAWRSYTNKTSKSNYILMGKLETELIFAFI